MRSEYGPVNFKAKAKATDAFGASDPPAPSAPFHLGNHSRLRREHRDPMFPVAGPFDDVAFFGLLGGLPHRVLGDVQRDTGDLRLREPDWWRRPGSALGRRRPGGVGQRRLHDLALGCCGSARCPATGTRLGRSSAFPSGRRRGPPRAARGTRREAARSSAWVTACPSPAWDMPGRHRQAGKGTR